MNKTFGGKFTHTSDNQVLFKPSSINNLPSISLNQLQSQINGFKKKKLQNQSLKQVNQFNLKEFNVCSPFYDRMKTHKQNCKCPYHRKKRFQVLPVRHTHNIRQLFHHSQDKNNIKNQQNRYFRLSNKQNKNRNKNKNKNDMNTSFDQQKRILNTISGSPSKFKVNARNFTYEEFLKDCQYYILRQKGLSLIKPAHVIKKGAKQIFQFINTHLDYTQQKMTNWIQNIQKDRDYGQFYIDRFKQMKRNYELNLLRGNHKDSPVKLSNLYSMRNKKLASEKQNRNSNNVNHTKSIKKQQDNQKMEEHRQEETDNQCCQDDQNSQQKKQFILQRIIDDIKLKNKVSQKNLDQLINMDIKLFKNTFSNLQSNVQNDKYSEQILKRLENHGLNQLLKKLSNTSKSINDQKQKVNVVIQTIQFIRRHKNNKLSLLLQRNSIKSNGSKKIFGSKRNVQTTQNNNKTNNSMHSKKSSECSLSSSQRTLNQTSKNEQNLTTQNNFQAIQQQNQNDDENLHGQQKILKNLLNHGQNVRRSKLIKNQDYLKFQQQVKPVEQEEPQQQPQLSKSTLQHHKGYFRKAEKYLFQVNMGKTIVKNDDSIFTAKRKVRVMKMLLRQNPNTPQADQLREYIKQVEQRCHQKTQKQKKLNLQKKNSQSQSLKQQDVWKLINLDNFSYNLIFYNLTSKIKLQDNEDLCILLNQLKLNDKKLENKVSFKFHMMSELEENKKQSNKKRDDILMQQQMRNMQFQPEIQQKKQQDILLTTKRTLQNLNKNYSQTEQLAKQSKISGFFKKMSQTKLNFIKTQNKLLFGDKSHIKKVLRFAKNNLPETFQNYINNISYMTMKISNQSDQQQPMPQQFLIQNCYL